MASVSFAANVVPLFQRNQRHCSQWRTWVWCSRSLA